MSEILNQDEINALIETYKSAGIQSVTENNNSRQVRVYDFTRPDKFSKDHLRSLNMIHSRYGTSMAAGLMGLLRASCQADLLALDQLTFREYCASVPEGTMFVEVSLEPLTSSAIFEFNPLFVALCVDMLAGGNMVSEPTNLDISEIDKAIFKVIVDQALKKYVDAWSSCVTLRPSITQMTTDTTTKQIMLPGEAVLVAGYEVNVGDIVSMMSLCIQASAIEAVLPALTIGRTLNTSTQRGDRSAELLRKNFESVEVECQAILGRTLLTMEEIINLEVGDLIRLPTKTNGLAELCIENVPTYTGTMGLSGKNLAIKIAKPYMELDNIS